MTITLSAKENDELLEAISKSQNEAITLNSHQIDFLQYLIRKENNTSTKDAPKADQLSLKKNVEEIRYAYKDFLSHFPQIVCYYLPIISKYFFEKNKKQNGICLLFIPAALGIIFLFTFTFFFFGHTKTPWKAWKNKKEIILILLNSLKATLTALCGPIGESLSILKSNDEKKYIQRVNAAVLSTCMFIFFLLCSSIKLIIMTIKNLCKKKREKGEETKN